MHYKHTTTDFKDDIYVISLHPANVQKVSVLSTKIKKSQRISLDFNSMLLNLKLDSFSSLGAAYLKFMFNEKR